MKHPSDQDLIDYRFELASAHGLQVVERHLKDCSACRNRIASLDRTFSALDLLKEEPGVSELLVERVFQSLGGASTIAAGRMPSWIYAAAAMVAFILFVWFWPFGNTGGPRLAHQVAPPPAAEPEADLAALRADPPFPPASAIELNVLPRRDDVQLTIYNSADLTLVRERRKLTLKKGWNWLQFMWANTKIDPTSLTLEPMTHRDKIDVEQLVFPPRLKDLGRWLMFSEFSGQAEFELTYFTSGIGWRSFYMGTLTPDEQAMELNGYVRVSNRSGETYADAQTRLVVGKVNQVDTLASLTGRSAAYGVPLNALDKDGIEGWTTALGIRGTTYKFDKNGDNALSRFEVSLRRKEVKKEGLSEYVLYTIEGRETIPNGWDKRLPSFQASRVPVTSLYKYDEERWGQRVTRFVALKNDRHHRLGETPLPGGTVKIFHQLDDEQRLGFVGTTSTKYIPIDEKMEWELGAARRVRVRPELMRFETANHEFDGAGRVVGWDEIREWALVIENRRILPVEVEITRSTGAPVWTVEGRGHTRHDATHLRFKKRLEPHTSETINYTLTTYHGTRGDNR